MPGGDRSKIVSIQALRAVAATAVLLQHAAFRTFDVLAAGVDLFFVISGFIMVITCWSEFGQPDAGKRFMARRIVRIVPLYWLATAVAVAVHFYWKGKVPGASRLLESLLFYPFSTSPPLLSVGWTLNYEMVFYALFAVGMFLRPRVAILAISAAIALMVALGLMLGPVPRTNVAFPLALEFIFGMAVGIAYREGVTITKAAGFALIAGGFAVIGLGWGKGWFASNFDPMRALVWGLPAAVIVAGASLPRFDWRGASARAADFLGDASYALYLFHLPVVLFLAIHGLRWTPLLVATCIGVAIGIHLFIERPLLVWSRTRPRRLSPSQA